MNRKRINNLMQSIIDDLSLNLNGMSVLTECASGVFAVTPLIAALAGAERVVAIAKDSRYGSAKDNIDFLVKWAEELGVDNVIHATADNASLFAKDSNIVTNLNFLRPIGKDIIEQLPSDSCISLMWEPWEFRDEDLDLPLCNKLSVPVLGTNETNSRLNIFKYVGLTALKLLFELDIEVFNSKIMIIGGDPFAKEADKILSSIGATNIVIDPKDYDTLNSPNLKLQVSSCDAVVVLENHIENHIIGGKTGMPAEWLADNSIALVHICGKIDDDALHKYGVTKTS